MKDAYPVILMPEDSVCRVYVPDFDIHTHGDDIVDAIDTARGTIGLIGISMEDDGDTVPTASSLKDVKCGDHELATLVDVDFDECRKHNDLSAEKEKNARKSTFSFPLYAVFLVNCILAIMDHSANWLFWVGTALTATVFVLEIILAIRRRK